jgi:beta-lactamase superfamily II metal-dependent hydrolase
VLTIELLPAQRGDALWLTYGEPPDLHHVLIDGGPSETIGTLVPELERRLRELPGRTDRVELLTITHVDADHIQGAVSLLSDLARAPLFRDVWFNGCKHLPPSPLLGAVDGERLTAALDEHPRRWNRAFRGGPVVVPDDGELPRVVLAGGLELVLLSPTPEGLAKLAPQWERECRRAGLIRGQGAQIPRAWQRDQLLGWDIDGLAQRGYRRDRAAANGSSIAFIAAYGGKRVLCGADAHAEVLERSLDRLGPGPHAFAAVKVPHHGSRANLSPGLLERIRSRNWLISTNGARFGHPDEETLARIVTTQKRPVFHLNYAQSEYEPLILDAGARYSVRQPPRRRDGTAKGLVVRLS